MISTYLHNAGVSADPALVAATLQELELFLTSQPQVSGVWSYKVPELGEGGACSLFGHLQDEPFELHTVLEKTPASQQALDTLQTIVAFIEQKTAVDWFGIYQTRTTDTGAQLAKLAYRGAPSRPLFPLTPAFAATSNNVQVAMSGKGRVINDVASYVAKGGEYYTCDPKVQAEVCLPLFTESGECIGIIDAEAFQQGFFDEQKLVYFIAACIKIPQHLPQ
ncbi:GAF domain-containing protein [Pseudoalteromonas fenneropenaei]|uniref:GAF domain-containing protein n=1 Tax=Pseudoalteromonas fenneropenaei TaxID=1737459 RepID=A0ABV7CI88_9GAMM